MNGSRNFCSKSLVHHCEKEGCQGLMARVVPVFKSGDKLNVANYRPISITCTTCKILQHIISKQLVQYIEDNKLFYRNQHGFHKCLSTVTQLFETIHTFTSALNSRKQIDMFAIDLSKAFDTIYHAKLIRKMRELGVAVEIIKWVTAYLHNREQFVEISGARSHTLPVMSGVPQGSVLGPILFLLYINDIAKAVDSSIEVRLFADDRVLFTCVKSTADRILLNDALCAVDEWCTKWDMKINLDKTTCVMVSN